MTQLQPNSAGGPIVPRGETAIDGLIALITDAIRRSDDDLVARLDHILQDVEDLIQQTREQSGAAACYSVHEDQAPYRFTPFPRLDD